MALFVLELLSQFTQSIIFSDLYFWHILFSTFRRKSKNRQGLEYAITVKIFLYSNNFFRYSISKLKISRGSRIATVCIKNFD